MVRPAASEARPAAACAASSRSRCARIVAAAFLSVTRVLNATGCRSDLRSRRTRGHSSFVGRAFPSTVLRFGCCLRAACDVRGQIVGADPHCLLSHDHPGKIHRHDTPRARQRNRQDLRHRASIEQPRQFGRRRTAILRALASALHVRPSGVGTLATAHVLVSWWAVIAVRGRRGTCRGQRPATSADHRRLYDPQAGLSRRRPPCAALTTPCSRSTQRLRGCVTVRPFGADSGAAARRPA